MPWWPATEGRSCPNARLPDQWDQSFATGLPVAKSLQQRPLLDLDPVDESDLSVEKRRALTLTWLLGPVLYGIAVAFAIVDPRLSIGIFIFLGICCQPHTS